MKKLFTYIRTPYALKLYLVLAIILAVYVLIGQLGVVVWPERLHWRYSLLILIAVMAFWTIFTQVWRQNLQLTVGQSISFSVAVRHTAMLLVGKYFPGKVWGVVARERDAANQGIATGAVYAASYLEQLLTAHSGLLLGIWVLLSSRASGFLEMSLMVLSVLSVFVLPRLHDQFLEWLKAYSGRKWQGLSNLLAHFNIATSTYLVLFLGCLLQWVALGAILVAVEVFITGSWPAIPLLILLVGVNAIAMLAGFAALFAPGGIGVREGVMVALLTPTLGLAEATVLSVTMRIVMVCADLLLGSFVALSGQNLRGLQTGKRP